MQAYDVLRLPRCNVLYEGKAGGGHLLLVTPDVGVSAEFKTAGDVIHSLIGVTRVTLRRNDRLTVGASVLQTSRKRGRMLAVQAPENTKVDLIRDGKRIVGRGPGLQGV